MSATIEAMPYAHVSNITVRTMLAAYNQALIAIEYVSRRDGNFATVKQILKDAADHVDFTGDMYLDKYNDADMADYMYFLANELGWFAIGEMACDGAYIRFHYSIGV